jgi:hypothetical protein
VTGIKKDPIVKLPVARLSISDVERWHTRLRRDGMGDAGIKNQHGVLRAALSQAVRWGWVSTNVASLARLRSTKTRRPIRDDAQRCPIRDGCSRLDRPGRCAHASHRGRLRSAAR